jgi:hypothetical protein
MNTTVRRKKTELNPWLRGLLFLTTATSSVQAEDFMESEGLLNALTGRDVNKTQFMQSLRTVIGGWLEGGYTFNPDNPRDGFNGPLTFNDRANELLGDELYLFFNRPADTEGDRWDFGWRADFLFGTDSRFTQASGLDNNIVGDTFRFYKFAIPQLYVETFIPFGKGIAVKLGHFYTIIGNEAVTAPDNFFYSHAYTMQYGEPFTHTGFLAHYPVTHNISVSGGGVLGWDNFSKDPENLNFLGRVGWSSDDARTSLTAAIITGDVSKVSGNSRAPDRNRTMYSVVFSHDITEQLHYTLQHDRGIEQDAVANYTKAAQWFGINQYLFFRINETLSTGLRFEWFRDADGDRVIINGLSGPANYFAVTAGLNWKLLRWITFRPEVRYDWMDSNNGFKAFDNNSDTNQFVIAGDLIIQF